MPIEPAQPGNDEAMPRLPLEEVTMRGLERLMMAPAIPLAFGLLAAAPLSFATPARAQSEVSEVVVTGQATVRRRLHEQLSYGVGYADLDLRTEAGRQELDRRIVHTANYLCRTLGEQNHRSGVAPSCHDDAIARARRDARNAFQRVRSSVAPFKPGPAWVPPEQ
jgi:UrcA family protein